MYTDGLIERNPRIDEEAGLRTILAGLRGASAREILARIESVALGPEPRVLNDDVALLAIRVG